MRLVLIALIVAGCSGSEVALELQCQQNSDCSPAVCCGAPIGQGRCVNRTFAADCTGIICLDSCSQSSCSVTCTCTNGACTATQP